MLTALQAAATGDCYWTTLRILGKQARIYPACTSSSADAIDAASLHAAMSVCLACTTNARTATQATATSNGGRTTLRIPGKQARIYPACASSSADAIDAATLHAAISCCLASATKAPAALQATGATHCRGSAMHVPCQQSGIDSADGLATGSCASRTALHCAVLHNFPGFTNAPAAILHAPCGNGTGALAVDAGRGAASIDTRPYGLFSGTG